MAPGVHHLPWIYLGLVALVGVERLFELALSRRNLRRLVRRGGVEVGAGHYPWMVTLHAGLLAAAPLEVIFLRRPFLPALGVPMLLVLAGTMALRYWVVVSLGGRWTTRVVHVRDEPPVTRGPYRWMRHPNYLAVVLEVAALPLVHTAWVTALVFSLANAVVLRVRIRVEEAYLTRRRDAGRGKRA